MSILKSDILIVALLFIILFSFLALTGTLFSGYHFGDNHTILSLVNDHSKSPFFDVMYQWIQEDLDIRFRPIYIINLVVASKFLGNNIVLWALYTGFVGFLSMAFFYLGIRNWQFSKLESLLFISLVFLGAQTVIFFQIGPNEPIAMLFLSLSFYFMTHTNKHYFLNSCLFALFLILSALGKESFLIVTPAFIFLKIYQEKIIYQLTLKQAILKNWIALFPIFVMLLSLGIIFLFVGTNSIGYAGLENNATYLIQKLWQIIRIRLATYICLCLLTLIFACWHLKNITWNIQDIVKLIALICFVWINFFIYPKILIVLAPILIGYQFITNTQCRKFFLSALGPFLFAILVILPNTILYAKSGFYARYLLPSTIGISFFICWTIHEVKSVSRWSANMIILSVIVLLVALNRQTIYDAQLFVEEGIQTNKMLSAIVDHSQTSSKIVLVADPVENNELSDSLNKYLMFQHNIYIYSYAIKDEIQTTTSIFPDLAFQQHLYNLWLGFFKNRVVKELKSPPNMLIFFNKNMYPNFARENNLDTSEYKNILDADTQFGIFIKK